MSDEQPMNEPSLSQIEDLLTKVDLRADSSEQTKILLACGRAEGRAGLQTTLRRWKARAAAMSAVSVCLLAALIWRSPAVVPKSSPHIAEQVNEQSEDSRTIAERPRLRINSNDTLHAATDWSAWVEKMNSRPVQPDVESHDILPQRPTLTASSRIDLQNFLNE
jgi:hypothetical protein